MLIAPEGDDGEGKNEADSGSKDESAASNEWVESEDNNNNNNDDDNDNDGVDATEADDCGEPQRG
jgi:hypothetical protein